MARPANWYELDYESQRAWERNEKKHQMELDEAEDDKRRAEENAGRERRRQREYALALQSERDDYADEAAQHARLLSQAKRFIAVCGLTEKFEEWKREQLKRIEDDE